MSSFESQRPVPSSRRPAPPPPPPPSSTQKKLLPPPPPPPPWHKIPARSKSPIFRRIPTNQTARRESPTTAGKMQRPAPTRLISSSTRVRQRRHVPSPEPRHRPVSAQQNKSPSRSPQNQTARRESPTTAGRMQRPAHRRSSRSRRRAKQRRHVPSPEQRHRPVSEQQNKSPSRSPQNQTARSESPTTVGRMQRPALRRSSRSRRRAMQMRHVPSPEPRHRPVSAQQNKFPCRSPQNQTARSESPTTAGRMQRPAHRRSSRSRRRAKQRSPQLQPPEERHPNHPKMPPPLNNQGNPYAINVSTMGSCCDYVEKVKSAIQKSYSKPDCMIETFAKEMDINMTSLREHLFRSVIRVTGARETGKTSLCYGICEALYAEYQSRGNRSKRFNSYFVPGTTPDKPELCVTHYMQEMSMENGKVDWIKLWQSYDTVAIAKERYAKGIMLLDGDLFRGNEGAPQSAYGDTTKMTPTTSVHMCYKVEPSIAADLFLHPHGKSEVIRKRNVFKVLVHQLMKKNIKKTELSQMLSFN